jgi:tagatose-1,6-bisphosphate aldolase
MRVTALTAKNPVISILALDQAPALAEQLQLDLTLLDNQQSLDRLLRLIYEELAPLVSGVLFDPVYSFPLMALPHARGGTLIRLEQYRELPPEKLPELFPDFRLEEIRNNYALAKLKLSYNPQEAAALEKKQMLAEIQDYCRILGIDFLLELEIFPLEPVKNPNQAWEAFVETQLQALQELYAQAQLFALDTPADPLAIATLSTQLDVPWILRDPKITDYQQLKESFRMAVENGAKGFLFAESLWPELGQYRQATGEIDWVAVEKYFQTTVRDRVIELVRIATESLADS